MNKFNKSKMSKKTATQKIVKKENLKVKINNIEIKPQFLIIGLMAIITAISLIYFIFLKYSPIMNFKYEGYAVKGKEITENLLGASKHSEASDTQNSNANDNDKNIDLAKIEEQGTIFKKLGTYFIGNKEKTEIDLSYPIYINDKNTIYNLSQDITLISKDFEKVAGYPNISIADGKVYNGNSLERADSKEYIFAKTEEGIYINLKEIKINTTANEYVVPVNSLIVFEENEIKYYSLANNILVFNRINDVDYNSQVIIKNIEDNAQKVDNQYNYEELLAYLGIIGKDADKPANEEIIKEDTTTKEQEENKQEKEDKKENETTPSEDKQEEPQPENNEQGNQENKYIKPEVTAEEFTAEVYSAKSVLNIKDPTARIIEAPTFEIYKDGKIYLRRTYTQAGEIIVMGLDADTEYEIIGKYIYKNEEDKKIENTFFKGRVRTKGYESLGIITLNKEEGEIYNNKIQIKNVKITSDLQNEVIKGIDTVELKTGSIKTVLKNNKLNELLAGKEITIESSEGLKSNEKIDYELKFYDKKGKELKVENNKGKTRTSKQEPKVTIKIKEQDIVSVTLGIRLANKDNVDLENYKYIVRKPNGEIEKEEKLSQTQKEIKLDDLDSNQYYNLKIYADYELNDNKGIQKQIEIGDLVFATQPLSTLGSVELKVEGKDITTNKATLSYEIDEERTDKRLIQILNSIKVELINKNTGKVAKTTEIQDEELQTLRAGQKLEKMYENLVSNTTYEIKITSKVKPGTKEENAPVTYSYQSFTTVKSPAKVEIQNKFVTKDLIDLDVRIDDKDNAILNNKVRMELRDEKNTLIETSEVKTNKDWIRKTYNKLEENKTYTLKFYADEYNEGHTDATYKRNYLLKEIDILTEEGITGKIDLKSMLKKTTGKNLVDPSSKIKWYVQFVGGTSYYDKIYDKESNILRLGTLQGYQQSYTYNLKEYIGKEVTISFKIKADDGMSTYIQNDKAIGKNTTKVEGTSKENFKEYKQTLVVNNSGYVGFFLINSSNNKENTKVYIKDLQIELGNAKTEYEEYKYNMESKVLINLKDKRDEIITNDYYIKVYEDGKLIDTKKYEEIPESNKLENVEKELNIKEGHDYKLELAVKIRLRDYVISTFEFNTKNGEILGISNVTEYKDIQPEGNYIVLNDLDFRNEQANYLKTGSYIRFQGNINFNGHTVYKKTNNQTDYVLIDSIGEKGRIENIVLKIYCTNTTPAGIRGLFNTNYGTIYNIYISVEESIGIYNNDMQLLGGNNNGIISKFIINFKEQVCVKNTATIMYSNRGTVENGYIYGEDIKLVSSITSGTSILVVDNQRGKIKNVYSLVNYECNINFENKSLSLMVHNNNLGIVENIYTVGIGNIYNKDANPNVNGSGEVRNSYYINDKTFKGTLDRKITNKALWDIKFQNNMLNEEKKWEVDELVTLGYYPILKLNECMPRQEYITLPEMTDADLPEILFAETLENTNKTAKVKIHMHNPSGEEVIDIRVKNVDCTIESQEYANKRSEIIVTLDNPIKCVSKYSILSFTTKGAFNLEYKKEYNEMERIINVDLYNEIYTVEEWSEINKKNNENYKLMANLDFKNADPRKYAGQNLYGILDGQGHTIQNMYISNIGKTLFSLTSENTKVCNLNIKNYNLEKSGGNAGIFESGQGLNLDNVNVDMVNIKASTGNSIGGIIGYGHKCKLENSTFNNINIDNNYDSSVGIGGLVGEGSGDIKNIYVNNLNIRAHNISVSVGGLIGKGYSDASIISNVIINGNIETNNGSTGGLIGSGDYKIVNNIIKMNIIANGNFIGGLIGNKNSSNPVIKDNLYIGNIVNKKKTEYTGELFGKYGSNGINYIYSKNKINGKNIEEDKYKLEIKDLSKEETYRDILNFEDKYNYDDIDNKLPLLKNSDKTALLPNQEPIYIDNEDVSIKTVDTLREDSNRLKIRMEILNPKKIEISEIQIENMDLEILENRTTNGITYINIIGTPIKYYDNYHIKGIKYIKDGKECIQSTYYLIEEAFYKEITKHEDWQNIDKESYENYRLLTDLDFTGKQNINYNLKIGKLVTEGKMHTIKNITLNVGNTSNFGLISILKNGMENIRFENININCNENSTISSIGVIGRTEGNMSNIEFSNIHINISENSKTIDQVGCIGYSSAIHIDKINTNSVYINGGRNYVGGTFGYLSYKEINNIEASNINIESTASYVGGIIGRNEVLESNISITNLKIRDSNIKGNSNVGGIAGYGGFKEKGVVEDCVIEGNTHVGGALGNQIYASGNLNNTSVINSKIKGIKNIGGIIGTGGNIANATIVGSSIEGLQTNSENVGGIVGSIVWIPQQVGIKDSQVISKGINVGAIAGKGAQIYKSFVNNVKVEGYAYVGGITGSYDYGSIDHVYTNATVIATEHSAGGIVGYFDNTKKDESDNNSFITIYNSYYAEGKIQSKENIGGLVGEIVETLYSTGTYYGGNYVEAYLQSENSEKISLGIGNMSRENIKLTGNYYYKYSNINGSYPTEENERYIPTESYLVESDLKEEDTYKNKFKWNKSYFDYEVVKQSKYPILKYHVQMQDGINIPIDPMIKEDEVKNITNDNELETLNLDEKNLNFEKDRNESFAKVFRENLQYTFNYEGKIIKTYETYSEVESEDGSKVIRKDLQLYVKNGKLYALPVVIKRNSRNSEGEVKTVADNLILDNYNGKEYETVLGSDGRIYDLKEQLNYPENFVNKNIASIGNNLNDNLGEDSENSDNEKNLHKYEIEVVYKNGDTLRFNYQTGELINFSELENSSDIGVWEYIKEKTSEIGNFMGEDKNNKNMQNKYEESIKLQNKLEERPVEEAMEEQQEKDKLRKVNNKYIKDENTEEQNITTNKIKEEANNSLKEQKYISIYNTEKGEYQIYNEEELLDTSKQEVISENEKIEANNLKEYYASEGKAENTKMGIVWIALSIIGVVIILFAMKKR